MRRILLASLAVALLASPLAAKGKDTSAEEAKLKAEAAKQLADYAAWCAAHGAKKEGATAASEAASLDPKAPKLGDAQSALDALSDDAADAADAVAKERKTAGPRLAGAFDRLASLDHDAKDAPRFEDYVFRAFEWDPSKARLTKIQHAIDDAAGGGRFDEAGRLLVRVKRVDAEGAAAGRYDKTELTLATKDVLLLGSDKSELVGYVSLPRDWAKGKTYPVLVAVDGRGCGFLGAARTFAAQRGSRGVIVLAPCTLSNTNKLEAAKYPWYPQSLLDKWDAKRLEFDGPGVDGLLEVIHRRFGGEEKVFLTGFSGGGIYTYYKLLQDPAHVRGAAPACANFGGHGVQGAAGAGDGGGPPVHMFTGEKDPYRNDVEGQKPGIEGQTDLAQENLQRLGYTHVERTMVPGSGHAAMAPLVWKFVDTVLGAK